MGAPLGFAVAHLRAAMAMSSYSLWEAFHSREVLRDREVIGNSGLFLREHSRGAMAMAHLRGLCRGAMAQLRGHSRGAVARESKQTFLRLYRILIERGEFLRLYRILRSRFVFLEFNKKAI